MTEQISALYYVTIGVFALVGSIAAVLAFKGSELDAYENASRQLG